MQQHFSSTSRWLGALGLAAVFGLSSAQDAQASLPVGNEDLEINCASLSQPGTTCLEFDLTMKQLNLSPPQNLSFQMPLTPNPGQLGTPEGWGFIDVNVIIQNAQPLRVGGTDEEPIFLNQPATVK